MMKGDIRIQLKMMAKRAPANDMVIGSWTNRFPR